MFSELGMKFCAVLESVIIWSTSLRLAKSTKERLWTFLIIEQEKMLFGLCKHGYFNGGDVVVIITYTPVRVEPLAGKKVFVYVVIVNGADGIGTEHRLSCVAKNATN